MNLNIYILDPLVPGVMYVEGSTAIPARLWSVSRGVRKARLREEEEKEEKKDVFRRKDEMDSKF